LGKEYIKAVIYTTTQGAEALESVLLSQGIDGCLVEDPEDIRYIAEASACRGYDLTEIPPSPDPSNQETRVTFWLENDRPGKGKLHETRLALMKLKGDEQYGLFGPDADFGRLWLDSEIVIDDWKDKYKETFHQFSPCEGVEVLPPWEVETSVGAAPDSGRTDAIRIVIDPGMAFGTGSHETTSMCLARLKALLKPGGQALDAGTGSAILAIAAALLGAGRVTAVEIDEDAACSAAGNIEANGVSDRVDLIVGDISAAGVLPEGARYDLIMANLSCALLEKLLPAFKRLLKDDGAMILSGLLDAQEERALDALEGESLRAADTVKAGEWLMLEVRK